MCQLLGGGGGGTRLGILTELGGHKASLLPELQKMASKSSERFFSLDRKIT
jgi:hypothetical protein